MSYFMPSPKSGKDWTPNDLIAYGINVVYQDSATFFEIPSLPAPDVGNEILTSVDAETAEHDGAYTLLGTTDLAMTTPHGQASAVADFVVQLFRVLGYTGRAVGRVARTGNDLSFWVCGEERRAKTDACIVDASGNIVLLVQEDKQHLGDTDPEPKLIASAIAALSIKNKTRQRVLGMEIRQDKVFPGITMMGTMPIFYKIPVYKDLIHDVQTGRRTPWTPSSTVYDHIPVVPRPAHRHSEGMRPLDNRAAILSCFEAFKRFL